MPEHLQSTAGVPLSKVPNPGMLIYGPAMNSSRGGPCLRLLWTLPMTPEGTKRIRRQDVDLLIPFMVPVLLLLKTDPLRCFAVATV